MVLTVATRTLVAKLSTAATVSKLPLVVDLVGGPR